jgi:UDP-N-acetyl-D-mannosaminuronate dehydrogenase
MFSPQTYGLLSVVEKISKEAKSGTLVSIESAIPKGTSKKVFEIPNHRFHVVHPPHRWYSLDEKEHGVNQQRILGVYVIVVLKQVCSSIVVVLIMFMTMDEVIHLPLHSKV